MRLRDLFFRPDYSIRPIGPENPEDLLREDYAVDPNVDDILTEDYREER